LGAIAKPNKILAVMGIVFNQLSRIQLQKNKPCLVLNKAYLFAVVSLTIDLI
jgi:hypothetical protein